jgi:hypothetical protein
MDLTNYPPRSDQKLGPNPVFPKVIRYAMAKSSSAFDIMRRYEKCGCYIHYPSFVEEIPGYCTIHGGAEPCFLKHRTQQRKLVKMLEEFDRAIVDIELKKKNVHRILTRDESPERRREPDVKLRFIKH